MLRQFHGNDMLALRRMACERLATTRPSPLAVERLLVPNGGMAKWLRYEVAATQGIAAQIACDSPAVFLRNLARIVLDPMPRAQAKAWDKDRLELRLVELLPGLLANPAFEPVAQYLADTRDPCRLYRLSRRLAELFDRYLLWRPDWILAWEEGRRATGTPEETHPWQPLLWCALRDAVRADCPQALHHAALVRELEAALRGGRERSPLPPRVTGFGIGAFTPGLLQVLHALAARIDVALYVFNPCEAYWNDLVSPREHARQRVHDPARAALSDIGNPLLASWGRLGREQLGLLLSEEEADLQWVGAARNDETLLQVLQNDILTLRDRDRLFTPPADDHSVIFAETHSRIREIEVLHDALLHLFQRMSGLEPRDVVVMAPAIEEYAGAIEAVFGEISDERRIPWTIADRAALAGDTAARAFLHLLTLPESRFGANEMLGLLSVPAIARRFGIDAEELEDLRDRVLASGVRRGLDESGSAGPGPALERNTWRFGLRRLLLGIALEDTGPFSGILPIASGGGEDAERIGELADFIDALERHAEALSTPRSPGEWRTALLALLADFFPEASTEFPGVALIQRAIEESCELLEEVRLTATLPREMLVELLTARLAREDGGHGFLGSGVNFCQLTPLRSIPFRVVCLLGMNATGFPRQHEAPAFDLMAGDRRPGDPSRRDDDRYLFLESLVAARDCLYLSRVAKDQRSDELQEPALPLAELGDYIDRRCGKDTVKRLTRQHPLMPFDPRAFDATNGQPSFRREWLPARDALGKRQGAVFGREALPPRAGSTPRLDELLAFWRNPARALLAERWGIRLDEGKASPEDREPLTLDALEKHRLREELLAGLVGEGESLAAARLLASGTLPHGASAQALLQQECDRLMPLALRLRDALRPAERHSIALPADLPVCGVLDGLQAGRLLEWTISEQAGGRLLLRFWIRHLVGSAADALAGPSTLYTAKKVHTLAPLAPGDATALLHDLVRLREEGLCRALPFFPGAAWAFSKTGKIDDARSAFLGNDFTRGDSQDASIARVFGESAEVLDGEFCDLARCVFGPLRTWLSEGEA